MFKYVIENNVNLFHYIWHTLTWSIATALHRAVVKDEKSIRINMAEMSDFKWLVARCRSHSGVALQAKKPRAGLIPVGFKLIAKCRPQLIACSASRISTNGFAVWIYTNETTCTKGCRAALVTMHVWVWQVVSPPSVVCEGVLSWEAFAVLQYLILSLYDHR